jgi:hypothetical protein
MARLVLLNQADIAPECRAAGIRAHLAAFTVPRSTRLDSDTYPELCSGTAPYTCDNFLGHLQGLGYLAHRILELLAGSYMTKKKQFLELAIF